MCHLIWLLSRKYGTVWYHPASSKLWYLTALSFVNFQEKLTGTSFALCACEASFVRLAVWLALSALFASTASKQYRNRLESGCCQEINSDPAWLEKMIHTIIKQSASGQILYNFHYLFFGEFVIALFLFSQHHSSSSSGCIDRSPANL
jgi:hypothetical protein